MSDSINAPDSRLDAVKKAHFHPVALAIDSFVHRVRDIEDCERFFVPAAMAQKSQDSTAILAEMKQMRDSSTPSDQFATGGGIRALVDVVRRLERVLRSDRARTLRFSLFLGIFSAYDTFTGDLLGALFAIRPELFHRFEGEIAVADVLAAPSLDELKTQVLAERVEELRRKSYIEQFEVLEKLFDIKLKSFDKWSKFVEIAQRRNLFAHCDGVVSPQYLAVCKREGAAPEDLLGSKLDISEEYFGNACSLVVEVGLKLGQTLWRKVAPSELLVADKHLHHVSYEALQFSEWQWARTIGEFGLAQKKCSTEENRLIFVINYAIALKNGNDSLAAQALLDAEDWTAKSAEFRLAAAVLQENYDDAAKLMVRIGPNGDLLDDSGYHDWPLFRDFRGTPEFLIAYERVYDRPFTVEISKSLSAVASGTKELETSTQPPLDPFD